MNKFASYRAQQPDADANMPDTLIVNDHLKGARKVFRRIREVGRTTRSMNVCIDQINGRQEEVVYHGRSPVASHDLGPPEEITFYDTPVFRLLGMSASTPEHPPFKDDLRSYEIPAGSSR